MAVAVELATRTLRECEQIIERGLTTFVEVGQALMEIRDGRLYREQGHSTFEDYCQERWKWGRNYVNKQIQAAQVATILGTLVPKTERQARELVPLLRQDEAAVVEVWRELKEQHGERITAEKVREAVSTRLERSQEPPAPAPAHVSFNSGNNEWYTPTEYIEAARRVMGKIDLDPASSDIANKTVKASTYFTAKDNGLGRQWAGCVWMNPRRYGIMCPCQNKYAVPNAASSSLQHWSISHREQRKQTDLPLGVESAYAQKTELAYALENLLSDSSDAMPRLIAVLESVPNASALTLLQIFFLVASLTLEPAFPHGAETVLVNTLGLSKSGDALILWNEIKLSLKSNVIPTLNEGVSESAFSQKPLITSDDNDISISHGIGTQKIGRPASDIGIIVAPTAVQQENLHRITSSPSQISSVQEPSQQTSYQPAHDVIAPSSIDLHMSGAKIHLLSDASSITLPPCPNGCERVLLKYPITIWMNPPYAAELIGKFTEKLVEHFIDGDVAEAIVLVNNATETNWFQGLLAHASTVCFVKQRVRFIDMDGNPGAPLQGQTVLYLGDNPGSFAKEFAVFGIVLYGATGRNQE